MKGTTQFSARNTDLAEAPIPKGIIQNIPDVLKLEKTSLISKTKKDKYNFICICCNDSSTYKDIGTN